ncbi:MAG: presenilin family intramembrane aspartyl protease [Candidatus Nanoarchaeia archaeon]|nr:presenilin family intramembrane aspartyl protease [Candidatus Nanoarchaeia archaeon]
MKQENKTKAIILSLFLITQIIAILLLNNYTPTINYSENNTINITQEKLPLGINSQQNQTNEFNLFSFFLSLIFVILIFTLLMKYKIKYVMKVWFSLIVVLSLTITINGFLFKLPINNIFFYSVLIALVLSYFKIIKANYYIHNFTETLIYPGVSLILVYAIYNPTKPLMNVFFILGLLILISIYDMWAVWKSKIMQKMANYQMKEVKIFSGFLIPLIDDKTKKEIKIIKEKYKNKKIPQKIKNKKFKIKFAALGGGDVAFPILTSGIFMWTFQDQSLFNIPGLIPALFVIIGAFLGLGFLLIFKKQNKVYPAMPFISSGILISLLLWFLIFLI